MWSILAPVSWSATWVLIFLMAVVGILLLLWLANEFFGQGGFPGGRREGAGRSASASPAGEAREQTFRLSEADRLAREGRFAEAIHLLLLAAIAHLAMGLEVQPSPSSTSRELLRTLPLPGGAREVFRDLVHHVEESLFGGRPLDAGQYQACRHRFRDLVPGATP